ncbi:YheC/YheD family protein [Thermoflavimicrobium daqui]|uniref:YheC/YheD family protein n=1 Tax=Thermoflavimicrobium daqui TaxID=2137476 RepID=A0A364K3S7_9BACL|nr:YheC/YheD family protein [Thermoflavimicrobium daqui]RAL23376.1 hypothetical protein DL897_11855 [Thermoflavimicrobium daqui]
MRIRRYQQIASKALKTMVLLKHDSVKPYIPESGWYHQETLLSMLEKYTSVYIKPDKGGGGEGIIRIRQIQDEIYEYCSPYHCRYVVGKKQLIKAIDRKLSPLKRYIIQQGISLATIKDRPFDLRIFLQKPDEKWELTGMVAKIASPGQIVTNYCKGSRPCEVSRVLRYITRNNEKKMSELFYELYYLSKNVAKILNHRFNGLKELGIDVGIDKQNHIWIFEVNTRPRFKMFSKLVNPIMYNQIVKNHKKII